jgi:iron complex outermembrane receptor protein
MSAARASAQVEVERLTQDLKRLTLEELAEVDITTASRRVERLSVTPAAVSIVTDEDVRRSGVTTVADAMRLAGGVDVARIHGNAWAVSARGFTISTANKLLVLVDGRTVYSPLFSGTFWDAQDMILGDIDRIEVVRGPGGSTWGANAVNGVINIISKPAAATRGSFVTLTAGAPDHIIAGVRYGGRFGASGSYRVYGKFRDRGGQFQASGPSAGDTMRYGQSGFRLESPTGPRSWFVQGDLYSSSLGLLNNDDGEISGGNVMARWNRRFSDRANVQAQVYYNRTRRFIPNQFEETRDTFDAEVLQRVRLAARHDVVLGGTFRVSHGTDLGSAGFFFEPEERTDSLVSAFVQDEIGLWAGRAFLTLGSKFERNDFTGVEVQPTARLRMSFDGRQTVWGAVSRAVRLPTRFDTDLRLINRATGGVTLTGSSDFDAETVVAYEAGYRVRPHARVLLDASVFTNRYDDLRSQELPSAADQPIVLANMLNATSAGLELATTVQPIDRWRLHASYAYLQHDFSVDPGSRDPFDGAFEANDPSHILGLRSWVNLPRGLQFDIVGRVIGRRPSPVADRYAEMDVRLGWTFRPGLDISLVGQNLLHARHSELFTAGSPRYALRRGAYVRTTWRF